MPEFEVSGLKELDKKLKRFSTRVETKLLRKAARAGAKVIQDQAIANAPLGNTGKLKKNIVIRTYKRPRGILATVTIRKIKKADNEKNSFYAHFSEFGTKTKSGAQKQRGQRWMTRAFEAQDRNALEQFRKVLAIEIDKEGRKR